MKFFVALFFVCAAACLRAQTPPPNPNAVPQPTITLSTENPAKAMPAVPPDKVVIAVGETKITAQQFDQIIDTLGDQYKTIARGAGRKQFADNVVRILVLAEEARRRKLDQAPAFKTQAAFASSSVLASMVYADINKSINPDAAEVRKYYEEHKKEFDQVHARHILIRAQGSPLQVKPGQKDLSDGEALEKAKELRKKIAEGADFAAIATAESDDTGSGAKGGDLGFFRRGQMVPTFEEAAFSLKPGELSEPVRTPFGYHIIKVEAVKTFDDLRPDVERVMRPALAQKAAEELQKKASVTIDPEFFGVEKK